MRFSSKIFYHLFRILDLPAKIFLSGKFDSLLVKRLEFSTIEQERRAKFIGYVSLLLAGSIFFYLIVDALSGHISNVLAEGITIAVVIGCYVLNRLGYHTLASWGLLLIADLFIFYLASVEPLETGAFVFFLTNSLCAITFFGYKDRMWAFVYVLLTFAISYLALFKPIDFGFATARYTQEYIYLNLVINFFASLIISVVFSMFMIANYKYSERQLKRKQTELSLKNEELVKINAELDSFVYRASHDLRSPLSSILGLANIGAGSKDVNEMKMCFSLIRERIDAQDALIKDIIDYSRNVRVDVRYESIPLNKVIFGIIDLLSYAEGADLIDFHVEIDERITIISDLGRLKTILINLISNSIKYHDPKKEKKFVRITLQTENDYHFIRVIDNGIGIPDKLQAKIFTMFYRATEKSKGSGLGLFIAQEMANRLKGKISFSSEPEVGTTFIIKLPFNQM